VCVVRYLPDWGGETGVGEGDGGRRVSSGGNVAKGLADSCVGERGVGVRVPWRDFTQG
jgi:hypothetical protein